MLKLTQRFLDYKHYRRRVWANQTAHDYFADMALALRLTQASAKYERLAEHHLKQMKIAQAAVAHFEHNKVLGCILRGIYQAKLSVFFLLVALLVSGIWFAVSGVFMSIVRPYG